MKRPIEERQTILLSFLAGEISKDRAANLLGCTKRTIEIYRNAYRKKGREGLIDHRHSNYHKLSQEQKDKVIALKKKDMILTTTGGIFIRVQEKLLVPCRNYLILVLLF